MIVIGKCGDHLMTKEKKNGAGELMTVKISGDLKGGYLLLTQKLLNFSSSAKSVLTLQKSRWA